MISNRAAKKGRPIFFEDMKKNSDAVILEASAKLTPSPKIQYYYSCFLLVIVGVLYSTTAGKTFRYSSVTGPHVLKPLLKPRADHGRGHLLHHLPPSILFSDEFFVLGLITC